uniref:Uncharacterized protein n=1 Tax=Tanacetum cinerariifolium TaxID=118510 RepID=A0A699I499_TANCI|nr:hypothetical protein [Tanacetum cinerariifolium]
MKKTQILTRLYGVTPMIVLRCNLFKARYVTQQDCNVTTCKVYVVTLLLWMDKLSESALRRGLDHVNLVIILPLEHRISRVLGTVAGVDINTLTMEQYLALSRENQAPGVVKPEIEGNVNFEIKIQFMRELRWVDRLTPRAVNTWDLLKKPLSKGPHFDKECPLNEEVKQLEEVKYGEFGRSAPFNRSNGAKFRVGPPGYYTHTDNRPPYE